MLPKQADEDDDTDPEEELRRRLIEYKMIKEAVETVETIKIDKSEEKKKYQF